MTNATFKAFIKEQEQTLKNTTRRTCRRVCTKVSESVMAAIEGQKTFIEETIESGKNFHLLNAAHDRVEAMENYLYDIDKIYRRGQYEPTYEETVFDGWVD